MDMELEALSSGATKRHDEQVSMYETETEIALAHEESSQPDTISSPDTSSSPGLVIITQQEDSQAEAEAKQQE